jgi:radical SAM superfamily enzyme YgiQ (UPF0313 family)
MSQAGAYSMFVGVETASSGVLNSLHKGINTGQARKAVEILKANGLEIWASYILGAPEEGRRDIMSTIRYSMNLILIPHSSLSLHHFREQIFMRI